MKGPYVIKAGAGLNDAGKYFKVRQQFERHATWHTDPAKASAFRSIVEARTILHRAFPTTYHQLTIEPLPAPAPSPAGPSTACTGDLFSAVPA